MRMREYGIDTRPERDIGEGCTSPGAINLPQNPQAVGMTKRLNMDRAIR